MIDLVSQIDELGIKSPDSILAEICEKIDDNSTVLLIDEYDAPLIHHIDDPNELQNIMNLLNDFYATLKDYTDKFRLIFITGVTRTSHISIFSAFNNLRDISLSEKFNSLLGFTQNDLEQYFDECVDESAKILNMKKEDLYQRLEQYYDGFQFAINAKETVYNPWSILSFFTSPTDGLENYWFKSAGSSSAVMQYLKKDNFLESFNDENNAIIVDKDNLSDRYEITNIPTHILLFQSGYLIIRKILNNMAKLVYPNTEVEDSIFKLYLAANNLNLNLNLKLAEKINNLAENIDQKNLPFIVDTFNAILNDAVSTLSSIFKDERSVRDIIYAALPQGITVQKIKERQTNVFLILNF